MTNFCVAIFLSYLSRKKGVSFHKQEVLLMVAASTTLQRLWTHAGHPPTCTQTSHFVAQTHTHLCVSLTPRNAEGRALISIRTAQSCKWRRSAALSHTQVQVLLRLPQHWFLIRHKQVGTDLTSVFSVKVVARLLNFWKFGKKKWSLVPITLHFNEWVHSIVYKWENSYVIYCEFFIVYLLYKFGVYFVNL